MTFKIYESEREKQARIRARKVYNRIRYLPLEKQKEILNRLYVGLMPPEENPVINQNPTELESNIREVIYIMQILRKEMDISSLELLNMIEDGVGIEEAVNNCQFYENYGNQYTVLNRWRGLE